MSITTTRRLTVSNLGPTVAQVRALIEGADDEARVSINQDKGYNQFDPGSTSLSVEVSDG